MTITISCCGQLAAHAFLVSYALVRLHPRHSGFDSSTHLSFEDVAVDDQLNLKESKTDPFRKGVQVVIGSTGDELCPVNALMAYFAVRGDSPGPLFRFGAGRPLTRSAFVTKVKAALQLLGLPASKYAGHSFHAGAATTVAGIEDSYKNHGKVGKLGIFMVYSYSSGLATGCCSSAITRSLTVLKATLDNYLLYR